MKKGKLILFIPWALFIICLCFNSCKKEYSNADLKNNPKTTLSKDGPDFKARLKAIKDQFYLLKLDEKFIPNVKKDMIWTPDWEHPNTQIVNDTVSYVFYRLIPRLKKDGKLLEANEISAASYLMVKNEKEFFKAFYYYPQSSEATTKAKDNFKIDHFTGNLLLTNLQNKQNFLLEYVNGRVSQSYQNKRLLAVNRSALTRPNSISYVETSCNTVIVNCRFSSLSPSWCGGSVNIVYSATCLWPQGFCGEVYSLEDSSEETVCVDIWYPDPPNGPNDPGGNTDGNVDDNGHETAEGVFYRKIDKTGLKKCMSDILTNITYETENGIAAVIKKFSGETPGYNWTVKEGVLPSDVNGITSPLYDRTTGTVTTTFDSGKFNDASDLSVARTMMHESIHAYLIAFFKTDQQSFITTYPEMVNEWGTYQNWNETHHSQFVKTFVSDLGIALQGYGIGRGYDFSDQFYQDLAWGGLTHTLDASGNPIETSWFKSAVPNPNDRKRILDNIQAEQYGKDTEGKLKAKRGRSANCN
ncbi:hypothetical protein [Pedobacter nototheniae]|uniref:hypothetical protein n=1 Tax=Pedobacter nototheniae TaxID=2488994 RepID=UPI00103DD2AE|nr:hypothetical protein [Pedobacter nototheniae]